MRTLFLSLCVCAAAECANCEAPVQSAALLQSSAQRAKGPAPHAFGPAHFFGPGPYGRHTFGPPMGANMAGRMGPHMPQLRHMPRRHNQSFVKMDASSMYGSSYGGAAFTPCDNPGAFDPSLEIWGYCDMWSMSVTPTEQECTAAGCRWSYGWCDCLEKPGCLAVGGRWDSHTCANELENLDFYKADFEAAMASGTCEGSQGDFLKSMVAYPASHCCSDYPNTFCEKGIQKMTPCKEAADFMPNAYYYTYCDLWEVNPTKETCEAQPGCKEEWGYCNCKTRAGCDALGGYFWGEKCSAAVQWWYPEVHAAVSAAKDSGTCQGKTAYHSDIKYTVDWVGHPCCSTGKSICEELDNYVSEYQSYY